MVDQLEFIRDRLDDVRSDGYGVGVDPLGSLLDGPRARGAFVLRTSWSGPWSLSVMSEAPLTVLSAPKGAFHVVHPEAGVVHVGPGDLVITSGDAHYVTADHPDTRPTIEIHPGEVCRSLTGEPLEEAMALGVRSWGNHHDGDTVMLVGAYRTFGEIGERLVGALPPLLRLGADEWDGAPVRLLNDEAMLDHAGQDAVLDRLLDLVVVSALRAWFERPDTAAPAWYRARIDPVVGHALRLMQHHPAEPWTVAGLASAAGVSRAVFARRFTELVGEPPMTFLTAWRIDVAAELLRWPGSTVASVAGEVGYATPYALSAAFKRVRGISPREHRTLAAR